MDIQSDVKGYSAVADGMSSSVYWSAVSSILNHPWLFLLVLFLFFLIIGNIVGRRNRIKVIRIDWESLKGRKPKASTNSNALALDKASADSLKKLQNQNEQINFENHHFGHELDLTPEFILHCDIQANDFHNLEYVRVMSLATYLNQLRHQSPNNGRILDPDEPVKPAYLWRIVLTMVLSSKSIPEFAKYIAVPFIWSLPGFIGKRGGDILGFSAKRKFHNHDIGVDDVTMKTPFASAILRKFDTFIAGTSMIVNAAFAETYLNFVGREGGNFGFIDLQSSLFSYINAESNFQKNNTGKVLWNLLQPSPTPAPSLKLPSILSPDSVDIMLFGWDSTTKSKRLPRIPNPLRLEQGRDVINDLINEFVDLGPHPDKLHFACPKPFAPDIFPDLCLGWGGVSPMQTPREHMRNRIMSAVFNRLSANIYRLCGVPPSPGAQKLDYTDDMDSLFVVIAPDGEEIIFPERLVEKYSLPCRLFVNSSSFGAMLCVRDKLPPGRPEPPLDSIDPADRELYTQIPFSFCSRVGIRDPKTGVSLKELTFHAGLSVASDKDTSPFGAFEVHYYLGPEGLTAFHAGNGHHRPWTLPVYMDDPAFTTKEAHLACLIASANSVAVNLTARRQGIPAGGYIYHGICNDSVTVIEKILRDKISLFPVAAQGDAQASVLSVIKNELQPQVDSLAKGKRVNYLCHQELQRLEKTNPKLIEQLRLLSDMLQKITMVLKDLPEDHSVYPEKIPTAIDRLTFSNLKNVPFEFTKTFQDSLDSIKEYWKHQIAKQ